MTQAMQFYKDSENKLGEEIKIAKDLTKKEFTEDGWKYTFFFCKGILTKVEAYNNRQLIEVYNK